MPRAATVSIALHFAMLAGLGLISSLVHPPKAISYSVMVELQGKASSTDALSAPQTQATNHFHRGPVNSSVAEKQDSAFSNRMKCKTVVEDGGKVRQMGTHGIAHQPKRGAVASTIPHLKQVIPNEQESDSNGFDTAVSSVAEQPTVPSVAQQDSLHAAEKSALTSAVANVMDTARIDPLLHAGNTASLGMAQALGQIVERHRGTIKPIDTETLASQQINRVVVDADMEACTLFYRAEIARHGHGERDRNQEQLYVDALAYSSQVQTILSHEYSTDSIAYANNLRNIARCCDGLGEYEAAQVYLQQALDLYKSLAGDDSVAYASALVAQADHDIQLREYGTARALLERALVAYRRKFGNGSRPVLYLEKLAAEAGSDTSTSEKSNANPFNLVGWIAPAMDRLEYINVLQVQPWMWASGIPNLDQTVSDF
jgi:hypothetical protein